MPWFCIISHDSNPERRQNIYADSLNGPGRQIQSWKERFPGTEERGEIGNFYPYIIDISPDQILFSLLWVDSRFCTRKYRADDLTLIGRPQRLPIKKPDSMNIHRTGQCSAVRSENRSMKYFDNKDASARSIDSFSDKMQSQNFIIAQQVLAGYPLCMAERISYILWCICIRLVNTYIKDKNKN